MAKKKLKKAKNKASKNLQKHGPWSAAMVALGGVAGSVLADATVREKIASLVSDFMDRVSDKLQVTKGHHGHFEAHAGHAE